MEKVKLADFFTIDASLQGDKITFESADINDIDSLPFVSRTAKNNGLTGYCLPREGKVNSGGVISLALDGSTGATFYQHHSFLSGQNIWLLKPKADKIPEFTPQIALYLVSSIRKAVRAYTYNLSLTKTRLKKIMINLPLLDDGSLDVAHIKKLMAEVRHIDLLDQLPEERYQILT